MARVEYDRVAASYERGRGLALAAIAPWREALAAYLATAPRGPLLDVGAGTGTFARALAEWFARDVVALEPSPAMRREALRANPHPRVRPVAGRAEALPLRARTCAAAWLSTVLHHVDLAACARELRRALPGGAPVLVRSAFPDRATGIPLLRFFPEARRALARFPSSAWAADAFAAAGFALEDVREVAQESASSLRDFRDRVSAGRRADSLLASLDDAELARGLAELDAAVAAERTPVAVVDTLTLLVLR